MDSRLNELLNRIEAPGRPGDALSASEFTELVSVVREMVDTLDAYRFVFERKIATDFETIEALKTWQPGMYELIKKDSDRKESE